MPTLRCSELQCLLQDAEAPFTTGTSRKEQPRRSVSFCSYKRIHRCCNLDVEMIWFFDRDGEKLRYEITHDRLAGRHRGVIPKPYGSESIEEVDEPTELIERSVQLMNSLRGDGWRVA